MIKLVYIILSMFILQGCAPKEETINRVVYPGGGSQTKPDDSGSSDDSKDEVKEDYSNEVPMSAITVSSIAETEEGKPYLEVDGHPYAVYGAQIRFDIFTNCEQMPWAEVEEYFAAAQKMNINTVEVTVPWKFIESKEDKYDFSQVDKLLTFCNKYELKMELLWFSTNMIGDSYSWLVPAYVINNSDIKFKRNDPGATHYLYGYYHGLILNDEWLLERETKAITRLFDHIRIWDSKNGNRHPVIAAQIHNEPDAMVRWRMQEKAFKDKSGRAYTQSEIWQMTLDALDVVGQAVQNSTYKVATRTNVISKDGAGVKAWPQAPECYPGDVYDLKGIDFLSYDIYNETVNKVASDVAAYASLPGNYPLVGENRGAYSNTATLILAASALGAGYDIYDLATSQYIADRASDGYESEGILNPDLSDKGHTPAVRTIIDGLVKASPEVAVTSTKDFAAFNIVQDKPVAGIDQTMNTSGATVRFKSTNAAVGFALDRGDYIVAFADKSSTLTLSNGTVTSVTSGYFNPDGTFVSEDELPASEKVMMKPGILYKIGFRSSGSLESDTKKYIGTLFY